MSVFHFEIGRDAETQNELNVFGSGRPPKAEHLSKSTK